MADKAAVWRERLAACRASGLSTAAFCREQGLSYAQTMYWQHRLGNASRGLVPVQVVAPAAMAGSLALEVALPGVVSLHVRDASIADVVALVRGLSC
jgi:hypothetical protein